MKVFARPMPLLLLPLCLMLAGCLSGLATQKAKAFSDNPTPPDSGAYCCAVKAVFGDETCDAHPVVPQPLWDRAVKKCKVVEEAIQKLQS